MTLGFYYSYTSDFDRSLAEVEKAISLNPNNAELLAISAGVLPWLGRPKVALDNIQRAMRLNPHFPDWWYGNARDALFHSGHFEEALAAAKKAKPTLWNTMTLPLVYAQLGKEMKAETAAVALLEQEPEYSAEWWLSVMGPYAGQPELDLFLDSNRKAKLPICATDAQLAKYPDMMHLSECDARRVRS
jgi:adenylate cyclase